MNDNMNDNNIINGDRYFDYTFNENDYNEWVNKLTNTDKKKYEKMYPNFTFKQMFTRMMDRFGLILSPKDIEDKD